MEIPPSLMADMIMILWIEEGFIVNRRELGTDSFRDTKTTKNNWYIAVILRWR